MIYNILHITIPVMTSEEAYTKNLILKISNIGMLGIIDGRRDESFVAASEDNKD